jgi:hypothetical protein
MAAVGGLDLVIQTLSSYDPDNLITVSLGLVLAQVTKELNKK